MPVHHGGYPEQHPSPAAFPGQAECNRVPLDLNKTYPPYRGPASDDGVSYEQLESTDSPIGS